MRVSELVKSFEDQIALSPKSLSPRSTASGDVSQCCSNSTANECRDEVEDLLEAESVDISSEIPGDEEKVATHVAPTDELIERVDEGELKEEEELEELPNEHVSEFQSPESALHIQTSHGSELTDEASVEVYDKASNHDGSPRELLSEPQYSHSSCENEVESVYSELTDERRAPGIHCVGDGIGVSETKQADERRVSAHVGTQNPVGKDETSKSSQLTDESSRFESQVNKDVEMDAIAKLESQPVVRRDNTGSLAAATKETSPESRQEPFESQREPSFELHSRENIGTKALREAAPDVTLEPQLDQNDPPILPACKNDKTNIRNIDDVDVHQLLRDMEQSMNARFRRLEDTCQQIPMIMAQLELHVSETKAANNATIVEERTAQRMSSSPHDEGGNRHNNTTDTIRRAPGNLNVIESTETSKGTDDDFMESFPELQAFVNQLETDTTVAIADVLLEEKMSSLNESEDGASSSGEQEEMAHEEATRVVTFKEVPSDEEPQSSHDKEEDQSSHSSQDESILEAIPSIEPSIDSEQPILFRSEVPNRGAIVASTCSDLSTMEIFRFDPADGLKQLATFLDEKHASCDRACFVLCCNSEDMPS